MALQRMGWGLILLVMALGVLLASRHPGAAPATARPVIVLDPGHGGPDPGALSRSGVQEKLINLAIAQQTAARLSQAGLAVVLTRAGDTAALPGNPWVESDLRARTWIANHHGASLLISIHANAEPTHTAQGPIVYYYEGSWASEQLAKILEGQLARATGIYHAPRLSHHLVLQQANMPAVTVEVGFLTHAAEAEALTSPVWQARLAQAIARGIEQYLGIGS